MPEIIPQDGYEEMTSSFEKPTAKSAMNIMCLGFVLVISVASIVCAQEIPYIDVSIAANEAEGHDITLKTFFKLVPAINYQDRLWVIRNQDLVRIGYATWDDITRRYTIFNLRNEYRGFIQATIGEQVIGEAYYRPGASHYYTQYLWYWKDNLYRMVSIATLGGRPPQRTFPPYKLPYGELGHDLLNFAIGNIPLRPGNPFGAIEPMKGPMGIDISVKYRLPTIFSR
ncbi:MAG: hypothetical protein ACLPVO_08305 [Desulfomonilaceae bacterium]